MRNFMLAIAAVIGLVASTSAADNPLFSVAEKMKEVARGVRGVAHRGGGNFARVAARAAVNFAVRGPVHGGRDFFRDNRFRRDRDFFFGRGRDFFFDRRRDFDFRRDFFYGQRNNFYGLAFQNSYFAQRYFYYTPPVIVQQQDFYAPPPVIVQQPVITFSAQVDACVGGAGYIQRGYYGGHGGSYFPGRRY